ncbi:MAG: xylulokinase [Pseudomonadota bacterium]
MEPTNRPSKAVLGVDLGTSAVKCVVVSEGSILASATSDLDVASPRPGWSEQDPGSWLKAAKAAIREACTASSVPNDAIRGIGLSGQMHGAVTLDGGHRSLRPAILWNDNRSTAECKVLEQLVPDIGEVAGIGPLPGFTAPKLMWMRTEEPELFDKVRHVLLPKDYLALWLTGDESTDRSDAAGTLWLNQETRAWSTSIIEASGIDPSWLPELRDGYDAVGSLRAPVAEELGLTANVTVFAGGGDAATGALAMGAASPGRCMMSLGTSGQLLVVDDSYQPKPDKYVHAYCHTLPNTWFRMAAMLNGARPLAWFAGILGKSVEELLSLSQQADKARIPLFLPYLTGERSPHGDPEIRGGFYGLEDSTGAPAMARAVVEAVAFSMADAMDSFGGKSSLTAPIPVIGGGSKSDTVLQTLADALNVPVARAEAGQGGAALGAALLAEVGTGVRAPSDLSFNPALGHVCEPKPCAALTERLSKYRELYKALRPLSSTR